MTKREQSWIVLLCALIDLGGAASKQDVLAYIQEKKFWYRNDINSPFPSKRSNERQWRNEISYARQHMVEKGCIFNHRRNWWEITDSGRQFFCILTEKARNMTSFDDIRFTPAFYNYICLLNEVEPSPEETTDHLFMEQVLNTASEDSMPIELTNAPFPKGPGIKHPGKSTYYRRSPVVSSRALKFANYFCEIDLSHKSFLRRDLSHPYMEPHHLIPMKMTDRFDVSLDREQNIFCLCSNCHNQIHYGTPEDVRRMISVLFSRRKEQLCAILGQDIALNDIFEMYGVCEPI